MGLTWFDYWCSVVPNGCVHCRFCPWDTHRRARDVLDEDLGSHGDGVVNRILREPGLWTRPTTNADSYGQTLHLPESVSGRNETPFNIFNEKISSSILVFLILPIPSSIQRVLSEAVMAVGSPNP